MRLSLDRADGEHGHEVGERPKGNGEERPGMGHTVDHGE